jgi:hypothetical protein
MPSKGSGRGHSKAQNGPPKGPPSKKSLARFKASQKAAGQMLYHESEDTITTSLMNKAEGKARDVSYLERSSRKVVKPVEHEVIDEYDNTSSYDALLQSFQVKDINEARKVVKKRARDGHGEDNGEETRGKRKKPSKVAIPESSDEEVEDYQDEEDKGELDEEDGNEQIDQDDEDSSADEEDADIADRKRHEARVNRIKKIMDSGSSSDGDGEGEESEDQIGSEDEADSSTVSVADPYELHFSHSYSASESEELTDWENGPQRWTEIEKQTMFPANVWKDDRAAEALPCVTTTSQFGVNARVAYSWKIAFDEILKETLKPSPQSESSLPFSSVQQNLFSLLNTYSDVLYCLRNPLNGLEIMSTYALHVANHLTKSIEKVRASNAEIHKLAVARRKIKEEITAIKKSLEKKKKIQKEDSSDGEDAPKPSLSHEVPGEEGQTIELPTDLKLQPRSERVARLKELHSMLKQDEVEFRDQGFTKPKVLVILPMRNAALEFVELLMKVMPRGMVSVVENRRKFYGDYFEQVYVSRASRPLEWLATFRGHTDDTFRLGISFKHGKTMKLYSGFYNSDIIVASPLGLRLAADEAEQGATDYLSSIEMVIVDQADVMLMQNWEHVQWIFDHLSHLPEKPREEIDFSRVRNSLLNRQGRFFRQSIVLSSTLNVDINTLFNRQCRNSFGRYKIRPQNVEGTAALILAPSAALRQVFYRLDPPNAQAIDDLRFDYFTTQVWEHLSGAQNDGTLIVIPSYFDYLRVQKFFTKAIQTEEINVVNVSEYTKETRGIKYRKHFYTGRAQIMMITERYHFYKRIRIRGIKSVIWYGPPLFPQLYSEIANWVEEGGSILTLYTKYDSLNLEGIVGRNRCEAMLTSEKTTHSLSY